MGTVHLFGQFQDKLNSPLAIHWNQSSFSKITVAGEKADLLFGIPAQRTGRTGTYKERLFKRLFKNNIPSKSNYHFLMTLCTKLFI